MDIKYLKNLYKNGVNIMEHLGSNSIENILVSYDIQAGSYTRNVNENPDYNNAYCKALAGTINKLGKFNTILEAGTGEATTLNTVLQYLDKMPASFAFDISWSRLKYAMQLNIPNCKLFVADLFNIPLPDNSIDIVFTSHCIEPNSGREKEALQELYRVSSKYIVLLEPAYDLAGGEAKKRMRKHGYIRSLYKSARRLKYKIVEHRLFEVCSNPLNPTGLIIIKKDAGCTGAPALCCPVSGSRMDIIKDSYMYCESSGLVYQVLKGIPVLLKSCGVLASHLEE